MSVSAIADSRHEDLDHQREREDLACAFRWTARLGMHEAVANHFSLVVDPEGPVFLMNSYGRHFSKMRASDMVLINAGEEPDGLGDTVDPTAWCIHGAVHRNNPRARCILHVHSKYATALSALKDTSLPPIDQTTMRFYNRIALDSGFDGMGLGEEAERQSRLLGNKSILLMGQHGVMTIGETVAKAFDELYYFERACETLLLALSSGRELNIASHEVAEKTAQQWEAYPGAADKHFQALRDILDEEEPEYRS